MATKLDSRFAAFLLTASLALTSGGAFADNAPMSASQFKISANVAITSDYIFRGISQTNSGAAIQGGFDVTDGWLYAGGWASNVDFGTAVPNADLELDLYGGLRPVIGSTTFDLGFIYYKYPNVSSRYKLDYYEFYGGVTEDFHIVQLGGKIFYTPDNTLGTRSAWYYEGNGVVPIPLQVSLVKNAALIGHIGHYKFSNNLAAGPDYTDWRIGGQVDAGPVTLGLTYGNTDRAHASDDEVWVTLSHAFN